jgi:hypothetical protein
MKRLLTIVSLLAIALLVAAAQGAYVRVGNLILRVDGGFKPTSLPAKRHAPISIHARFDLSAVDRTIPPPLESVIINFDKDGRLDTNGLPVCRPARIADASPSRARRACGAAQVGDGFAEGKILMGSEPPVVGSTVLTFFNGPRRNGSPTVLIHAQITVPETQTFAIVAPITKRRGAYRYRVSVDVPPIIDGRGSITHVTAEVSRRYRAGGKRRTYIAARCSKGFLGAFGRLTFGDLERTVIFGPVMKPCNQLPGR